MRSYIRHPSDIPIDIKLSQDSGISSSHLSNVCHGGLAFNSVKAYNRGTRLLVKIDYVDPHFISEGIVTHCHKEAHEYVVGIEFICKDDVFVARMVEQICHIEHYKHLVAEREGRQLNGQEAANEWIKKYASHFPRFSV